MVSKDRARPFSRKHRRYWIPITGGMLLIGVINVGLGLCVYDPPPPPPQRIIPTLPPPTVIARPPGSIGLGELPAAVMRTFTRTYPRHVPSGATKLVLPDGTVTFEIWFTEGSATTRATFRADGTVVSEP